MHFYKELYELWPQQKIWAIYISGYRKLYLNSPKGYSRKTFNVQTEQVTLWLVRINFIPQKTEWYNVSL